MACCSTASMLARQLLAAWHTCCRELAGSFRQQAAPGENALLLQCRQAGRNATRQLLKHGELQTQLVGLGKRRGLQAQECERDKERTAQQCRRLGPRLWRHLVQRARTAMAALMRVLYRDKQPAPC